MNKAAGAQEATPVAEPAKAETVKEAPETFRFVIGEKIGMTQLFDEKGNLHGVSVATGAVDASDFIEAKQLTLILFKVIAAVA